MNDLWNALTRRLAYGLSLPERVVRALAAALGGTTRTLTDALFPEALRGTTFYRIVLGDVQRFVIEKIGEVKGQYGSDAPQPDLAAVERKIAGQTVDALGLLAFHVSPLWVFAIAADATAAGRVYLLRLVESLKQQGLLAPDAHPSGIEELLVQLGQAASASTELLDQPPVSPEEAARAARELLDRYRSAFGSVTGLLPRLDTLWAQMKALADREGISIERLGGLMSVDVLASGRRAGEAVFAIGTAASGLLAETLLSGYGRTLDAIRQEGLLSFAAARLDPYFAAARKHLDGTSPTWTQKAIGWLFGTS